LNEAKCSDESRRFANALAIGILIVSTVLANSISIEKEESWVSPQTSWVGIIVGAATYFYLVIPIRVVLSKQLQDIEIRLIKAVVADLQEIIDENSFTRLITHQLQAYRSILPSNSRTRR